MPKQQVLLQLVLTEDLQGAGPAECLLALLNCAALSASL